MLSSPYTNSTAAHAEPSNRRMVQMCRYFINGGKCKKGVACNFSHDAGGMSNDGDRREYALYCWNYQLSEREHELACRLADLGQYEHDLSCRDLDLMQREQIVACNHATLVQREEWLNTATNELTQFEQQLEAERKRLEQLSVLLEIPNKESNGHDPSEDPPRKDGPQSDKRSTEGLKTNEQIVKFWTKIRTAKALVDSATSR